MIIKFKNFINKFLKKFNLRLMKYTTYEKVILNDKTFDFNFISQIKIKENLSKTMHYFSKSRSQLRQDLFTLNQLNFKKKWFFCRVWCHRWN